MPIQAHIADFNNPHEDTKTHVGLSNIENYPLATQSEVMGLTRDDRYIDISNIGWIQEAFTEYMFNLGIIDSEGNIITVPDDVGTVNFTIDAVGAVGIDGYKIDIVTVNLIVRHEATTVFTQDNIAAVNGAWEADTSGLVLDRFLEYRLIVSIFDNNGIMIGRRVIIRPADSNENTDLNNHLLANNPHNTTKDHIGLGDVENMNYLTPQQCRTAVTQRLGDLGLV